MKISKWKIAKYLLPLAILGVVVPIISKQLGSNKLMNEKSFAILNCNEDIPVVDIDFTFSETSNREKINQAFGRDLCELCSWAYYKIPFNQIGKNGYLKVMSDFDHFTCKKCPIPLRYRYYAAISINKDNQVLYEEIPIEYSDLKQQVLNEFNNVGKETSAKDYNNLNFLFVWDKGADPIFIEEVLNQVANAYLNFLISKIALKGQSFHQLTNKEIAKYKQKYPLRIELDLGKLNAMSPQLLIPTLITPTTHHPYP